MYNFDLDHYHNPFKAIYMIQSMPEQYDQYLKFYVMYGELI